MKPIDQNEWLARYFSGEATADERAQVEAWRQAAVENRRVFAEFEKIWQIAAEKLPLVPSIDQAWTELSAKLGLPNEKLPAKILELKTARPHPRRKVFWSDRYVWAAAAILLLGFTTILYQFIYNANELKNVTTANAQQERLKLPDGSFVKLNSGSEIKFLENFSDTARSVSLSGEAYFEVIYDNRPFYVNTGNAQIRVVGTKFGIWARDGQTRVAVREGWVALRASEAASASAVILTANQASFCQKQEAPAAPKTVDAGQVLGWLEGRIVFEQTPLTEVIAELQRVYNVTIELSNPALGGNTITGSFQNKPIESVLASICLTLNLQYAPQEGKYVVVE